MERTFWDRFNDYGCINKNDVDDIFELGHYTKYPEAVFNITQGCFWATDIPDFNDGLEGVYILKRINELLKNMVDAKLLSEEQKGYVEKYIGSDEKINQYISDHVTSIVSLCRNLDSEYMWENYAGENGYCIQFNKEELLKSMYFRCKNGVSHDENYIKHAPIVYDSKEQVSIISKEVKEMLLVKDDTLIEEYTIEYIIRHLMYVGNYYKKHSASDTDAPYENEEEYRVLINTSVPGDGNISDDVLPEHKMNENNRKHYVELFFDPKSIKQIICRTQEAKDKISDQVRDIKLVVRSIKGSDPINHVADDGH